MSVYGEQDSKKSKETKNCEPLSCYGVAKIMSEKYLYIFRKQIPFVSLRMFNTYGPGQDMNNLRQGMVSIYIAQGMKNRKIDIKGSLKRIRDFIYIEDVVESWFRASNYNSSLNQAINVGTGLATEVKKLVKIIIKKIPGTTYRVLGSTKGDQNSIVADTALLRSKLKINKFTNLDKGIENFISSL